MAGKNTTSFYYTSRISGFRDYVVPSTERSLFEWLVFRQEGFGVDKPFRHSYAQVYEETREKQGPQARCFKFFENLGFLKMGTEYYMNQRYRSFFVDFAVLAREDVLGQIVHKGTETYNEQLKAAKILAKAQAKGEEPMTHKQITKILDSDEEAVNLLRVLNKVYADRVLWYNIGKLTGKKPRKKKLATNLVCTNSNFKKIMFLRKKYDDNSIRLSFLAYVDAILKEIIEVEKILPYFLSCEEGEFPVVDSFMEKATLKYTKENG